MADRAHSTSRRAMLVGLVVTAAPAAAAPPRHPDTDLLALDARRTALRQARNAALDRERAVGEVFDATLPAPPDRLCRADGAVYEHPEVDALERIDPATLAPAAAADRRAILAAWEDWAAHCEAHSDLVGLTAAEEATHRLAVEIEAVEDRILAAPARTIAGLKVKAGVLASLDQRAGLVDDVLAMGAA